jgi:hypothetical protein
LVLLLSVDPLIVAVIVVIVVIVYYFSLLLQKLNFHPVNEYLT